MKMVIILTTLLASSVLAHSATTVVEEEAISDIERRGTMSSCSSGYKSVNGKCCRTCQVYNYKCATLSASIYPEVS